MSGRRLRRWRIPAEQTRPCRLCRTTVRRSHLSDGVCPACLTQIPLWPTEAERPTPPERT